MALRLDAGYTRCIERSCIQMEFNGIKAKKKRDKMIIMDRLEENIAKTE